MRSVWKTSSMEIEECGECGVWKMQSVWKCGVWKMQSVWKIGSVENAEYGKCRACGNVLTWTELLISKHFNAFIQHQKCFEMFYY